MSNDLYSLYSFIDVAEKNRKYPPATAQSLRSALKKIESELNENEKASVDKLLENLEQIFHTFYQKNPTSMTLASLETYKGRVRKAIDHYLKYGVNPTGMAAWNPKPIVRKKSTKIEENHEGVINNNAELKEERSISTQNIARFELPLRPELDITAKAVILLPPDFTKSEIKKISAYITFLESIAKDDST